MLRSKEVLGNLVYYNKSPCFQKKKEIRKERVDQEKSYHRDPVAKSHYPEPLTVKNRLLFRYDSRRSVRNGGDSCDPLSVGIVDRNGLILITEILYDTFG